MHVIKYVLASQPNICVSPFTRQFPLPVFLSWLTGQENNQQTIYRNWPLKHRGLQKPGKTYTDNPIYIFLFKIWPVKLEILPFGLWCQHVLLDAFSLPTSGLAMYFLLQCVWAQGGMAALFIFKIPGATGHFLNDQKYPAILGYYDIGNELKFLWA